MMAMKEEHQNGLSTRSSEAGRVEDHALMQGIASRDPESLKILYDRHAPMVMALCHRILRDRHEAEDLLVDIFHEVWEKFDRYDPVRGNPVGYLVMLSRSRAIDRKRRRRQPVALDLASYDVDTKTTDVTPASESELAEDRASVKEALGTLQPDQRRAIECAYFDGLSQSEIAERLGKPLGTIKTYIRQGLLRLRDVMSARRAESIREPV